MLSFFFFKQKTAYEMRISDWSSDVCSSDLAQSQHLDERLGGGGFVPADPRRDVEKHRRNRRPVVPDPEGFVELGGGRIAREGEGEAIGALDDAQRQREAVDGEMRYPVRRIARARDAVDECRVRVGVRSAGHRVGKECVSTC